MIFSKNSKRYGVRLPTTDESRALARVHLSSPVEMAKVADMAGISVSKLKTFNAGVKGSTLGASGPQYVMVPKKHADQLRESLASGEIAAVQSTLVADNTPLNSRVYTVRSGDTLSSIASRLGVSTKDLQQWNKLRGSKLKPGQSLTIGAGSSAQRLANNSDSITYRVRKGDSLSSIAKRHGVNIKDVMRWNSDTANLQPGDKLTLFVKKQQHARFLTNQIIKKAPIPPGAFFIYAALCASTMMISLVKEPSFCKAKYVLTSVDALCW